MTKHGFLVLTQKNGREYWFNTVTKESSWVRPAELSESTKATKATTAITATAATAATAATKEKHIAKESSKKVTVSRTKKYLALQREVAKSLSNVYIDELFTKLEKKKPGVLNLRETVRLLQTISKPLTTKSTVKQTWRDLAKGKSEIGIKDLKEWVDLCVQVSTCQEQNRSSRTQKC